MITQGTCVRVVENLSVRKELKRAEKRRKENGSEDSQWYTSESPAYSRNLNPTRNHLTEQGNRHASLRNEQVPTARCMTEGLVKKQMFVVMRKIGRRDHGKV